MSQFDDDYGQSSNDGPKALREALEKAQERIKEQDAQLAKFAAQERTKTLGEALKSKGLDPKIAGIIPADADPEKWVEEFGSLFATTTPGGDQGESQGQANEAGTTVTEADQTALSQMSSTADSSGAQTAGSAEQAYKARLAAATTAEEVMAIAAESGLTR